MKQEDTAPMDFGDLTLIEVPVTYQGVKYILREADGSAACKWRDSMTRGIKMEDGKVSGVGNISESEPLLVSLCLHTAADDKLVPIATIKSWPARIQKSLFERAKKISELDEGEKTVAEIDKRIAELQKQRAETVAKESTAKKDATGLQDGSDSQES